MQQFVNPNQGTVEDHRTSRFGSNITALPKSNSDRGGRECRGIIDAVTLENSIGPCGLCTHQGQFLFRALSSIHLMNSNLIGEIMHFRLAVTRYKY